MDRDKPWWVKDLGGLNNAVGIGALALCVSAVYMKPFTYEEQLVLPGLLGGFLGYWLACRMVRKLKPESIPRSLVFPAFFALVINGVYFNLIYYPNPELGDVVYPDWYDQAIYPCFVLVMAMDFFVLGLMRLRFGAATFDHEGGEGAGRK